MFNPSQRFSWRNFIICMVILGLFLLYVEITTTHSDLLPSINPVILAILFYGGIGTCFIVGIVWRPNFRRIRKEQEREKSE